MRLISIFILITSTYFAKGQVLLLDDIGTIRSMDSVELGVFSVRKGFQLKAVDIDSWRTVHTYYANDDTLTYFTRNFPTGRRLFSQDTSKRDSRSVTFHFTNKEVLKELKSEMASKGYKFRNSQTLNYGNHIFVHNYYKTDNFEIDLTTERAQGKKVMYELAFRRKL